MPFEPLTAVSPVDGRYRKVSEALVPYFSEYGLIRARVRVECTYLAALSKANAGMRTLTVHELSFLRALHDISLEDARIIKQIEKEGYEDIPATNHDVKAVEYFIKKKLAGTSLKNVSEWVHFALTSEDVNSVAYGLALRDALEEALMPALRDIRQTLDGSAVAHASTPMLARTHGQPATPTTFGKELRIFEARLSRQLARLEASPLFVKWGGATGNYNAHVVAVPEVDWRAFAREFIGSFNAPGPEIALELNPYTTQIEPHDTYAELFDSLRRINTILIDCSQDMWRYISDGWLSQKQKEGEVGSSAMPHKVNPIDFENAEGNLGVANALFEHFSRKLPISRLQRDLSDSTVERSFGVALAHSLIGYSSLARGFGKIAVNEEAMLQALRSHPEILAEAIQTALRAAGADAPYEKLKNLTRGREVSMEDIAVFIEGLDIDSALKKRLKALTPEEYTGLAREIALGERG